MHVYLRRLITQDQHTVDLGFSLNFCTLIPVSPHSGFNTRVRQIQKIYVWKEAKERKVHFWWGKIRDRWEKFLFWGFSPHLIKNPCQTLRKKKNWRGKYIRSEDGPNQNRKAQNRECTDVCIISVKENKKTRKCINSFMIRFNFWVNVKFCSSIVLVLDQLVIKKKLKHPRGCQL